MKHKLRHEGDQVTIKTNINFHQFRIGDKVTIYRINSHGFICENDAGERWAVTDAEIL